ncbi:MAG: hypothetical protein R3B70_43715 [Polyangiaceae bacterium]
MIDVVALRTLLSEVVRDVVRAELARALSAQRPMSKAELAAALGKSTATIDRHVREGMPYAREGARRIFDLDACRAWLRNRPARESVEDMLDQGVVKKTRRVG